MSNKETSPKPLIFMWALPVGLAMLILVAYFLDGPGAAAVPPKTIDIGDGCKYIEYRLPNRTRMQSLVKCDNAVIINTGK